MARTGRRTAAVVAAAVAAAGVVGLLAQGVAASFGPRTVPLRRRPLSPRVTSLLANLTLAQKIGQMTQLNIDLIQVSPNSFDISPDKVAYYVNTFGVGSFLNVPAFASPNVSTWETMLATIQGVASSQGPGIPIIYGLDSVHGANYVYNATLFPQPLAVAATFNRTAAGVMAATGAKDTRAADIPWGFAPILGLMSNPIWPRCYETLGEDPFLASELATALVCGAQGGCPRALASPTAVAATAKHFFGYPNPRSGQDRTPAWIPWRHLQNYYRPAFQAAFEADVATTMESYSEVDGVPMASSGFYLNTVLRGMMGFEGMLVTDWAEIENLNSWHHVAPTTAAAVQLSMSRTTIDMSMVPEDTSFPTDLLAAVTAGAIPESRIDESAGRILALKEELGLLDEWVGGARVLSPGAAAERAALRATVGSAADRAAALDMARGAITLLQNTGSVLPLARGTNILLVGPSADSVAYQTGGWSIHWQGATDAEFPYGTTTLDALTSLATAYGLGLAYEPVCDINGVINATSWDRMVALARGWADVVVYVGGEVNYAEMPGDIQDLLLPAGQLETIAAVGTLPPPSVLVLFEGRPRLLDGVQGVVDAVLHGLLTGPDAGQAVAEILLGITVPSGRLPFTYPSQPGNALVHYWHTNPEALTYDPAWAFGTGLSYTNWTYSALVANATSLSLAQLAAGPLQVNVTVANTGTLTAATAVLLYLTDVYRTVTPEVKMLKGFDKVTVPAGTATTLTFLLPASSFGFWNEEEPPAWTIEPGAFVLTVQDAPLLATQVTVTA